MSEGSIASDLKPCPACGQQVPPELERDAATGAFALPENAEPDVYYCAVCGARMPY